jgi:hypothetical protein
MSDYLAEMNQVYQDVSTRVPLKHNPYLQAGELRELLVTCQCRQQYRILVNGDVPIPVFEHDKDITCDLCELSMKEVAVISGHSGGVFNASSIRL